MVCVCETGRERDVADLLFFFHFAAGNLNPINTILPVGDLNE